MPVKIFHFHNGSGGGVLSVIRNLLYYRQHAEIENHVIYTINKDDIADFQAPGLQGAATEQIFNYSSKWNFYYTIKQLAKLLPDEQAVIVAHDWLELGMVSQLGLKNPVVHILHGDFNYYYELALLHTINVDLHICVSSVIAHNLKSLIPDHAEKIYFLHFPVQEAELYTKKYTKAKCAYFVRDLTEERKQASILPLIDKELIRRGVYLEWHIAGGGIDFNKFLQFWPTYEPERIFFYGLLDATGIKKIMQSSTVFILPSLAEGFPVAVVEAMKYGLVPLVSKWGGAIDELIEDGESGFFLPIKDAEAYADCLAILNEDLSYLTALGANAKQRADYLFNPLINTKKYEDFFLKIRNMNLRSRKKISVYGSRLDQKWIPNIVVRFVRNFLTTSIK